MNYRDPWTSEEGSTGLSVTLWTHDNAVDVAICDDVTVGWQLYGTPSFRCATRRDVVLERLPPG